MEEGGSLKKKVSVDMERSCRNQSEICQEVELFYYSEFECEEENEEELFDEDDNSCGSNLDKLKLFEC